MSDTSFKALKHPVVIDWMLALFCVLMLCLMFAVPGQETIPFHLLFLSLALVYGLRVWRLGVTTIIICVVTISTGAAMVVHWQQGYIEAPELVEVPLMPALLAAMVWHAQRRASAQRQVEAMAEERTHNLVRQREFLRDACHAIRTPVTIARGHVELIECSLQQDLQLQDIAVVKVQLDRMARMSSRLMALAELDRGDSLTLRPVDLGEFVREIAQHWSASINRRWQIEVTKTGMIAIDADYFEKALDALVENALRFTTVTDVVRIECHPNAAGCVLEVADSGPGISLEDRKHVFERFWHLPSPDGSSGSGLGLATVQSVVRAHGGSVTALPAPEGGALMRVQVPTGVPAQSPAAVDDPSSTPIDVDSVRVDALRVDGLPIRTLTDLTRRVRTNEK
ncbi:MAG: HAMP domain-containing sensor histidine kinase [Candidatus Nanopelagicales bacterium]